MRNTDISKETVDQVIARSIRRGIGSTEPILRIARAQVDRIDELEANNERLEAELHEINVEFDQHQTKVSADFEGECWVAMRRLLKLTGFNYWNDPDGVTADAAEGYLTDVWGAGAEAHARVTELKAELVTALELVRDNVSGYAAECVLDAGQAALIPSNPAASGLDVEDV